MPPDNKSRLQTCLTDYHRRSGLGERLDPAHYEPELGSLFPEFQQLLIEGAMIDDARRPMPKTALPRSFGGYTLLRELGRGASGVVYEAVHRELSRRVALKVLRTGFDTHVTARERFRREARACAQIRHDNVVEIYEAGVEDDRPFYAMRLLDGVALSDSISAGTLPPLEELAKETADIAGALHTLHTAGIVHRDVKPSNLMIQPTGRFILADFGLARTTDAASLTQTGDALGTPLYMSPEQMLGKRDEIDGRTDIYGLGATLYQAVTGQTPFETRDLGRLLRMVLTERPIAPRKIKPEIPKALEQIILKCLEKRPEDRYANAQALEADLRAFARGDQVEGKPVSATRHGARRLLTSPPGLIAMALGAAAGVLGVLQMIGPPAPTVEITSLPDASVWLDGKELGDTKLSIALVAEVSEGDHVCEIRPHESGYATLVRRWNAEAGLVKSFDVTLPPNDWKDRARFDAFRKGLNIERAVLKTASTRAVLKDHDIPILIFPRGRILSRELTADDAAVRVDIPYMFEGEQPGELVFLLAGEVVARIPCPDPVDEYLLDLPIPAAVKRAARDGMEGEWRFERGGKVGAKATFQIVAPAPQLSRSLALVEKKVGHHASVRSIRAELLGELYLQHKLYSAALREVLPWTDPLKHARYRRADSPEADLRILLIGRAALLGAFENNRRQLAVCPMQDEIQAAINGTWDAAAKAAALGK